MNKDPNTPKIDKLRRNQRIVKRQIETRTAELEKTNESLRAEITKLKRTEEELNSLTQDCAENRSRERFFVVCRYRFAHDM